MLIFENIAVTERLLQCSGKLESGKQIHVIGPNGAGKSTLLAVLAGNLITKGTVRLQGKCLTDYNSRDLAQRRAYLPQQQFITCIMPVFQYLSLHIIYKVSGNELDQVINSLAEQFEIADKLDKPLSTLSGGQWQRVRLISVILQSWPSFNPNNQMLILDEPFTGLDINQQHLFAQLFDWLCKQGKTVILSSHDLNQTLHHADRVLLMDHGHIIAEGNAEDIITPDQLTSVYKIEFRQFQNNGMNWIMANI